MLNSCIQELAIEPKDSVGPAQLQIQKLKIVENAIKVIETFKVSSTLSEHLSFCLIDNNSYFDERFALLVDYSKDEGIKGESALILKNVGNVFNLKLGYIQEAKKGSSIKIEFDNNQNIKHVIFFTHLNVRNNRFDATEIQLTCDGSLKLFDYQYTSILVDPTTKSLVRHQIVKDDKTLLDLSDEVFFINMKINNKNEVLADLLPELFISSAYDFNSFDFQSRFEMIDMVLY
jgi:hypothetical protein